MQTILLIHDDAGIAGAVHDSLRDSANGNFLVEWSRQCSDGVARLARQDPLGPQAIAAVLADMSLPDSHGIATFDRLHQAAPRVPVLVICAPEGEAVAKLAMQRGAHDYLLQGQLDRYLLPRAVRSMIERARWAATLAQETGLAQAAVAATVFAGIHAAREESLRMSYLEQHDSLTGLPNRMLFNDRVNQAIALADRQQTSVAVMYLDLDRFKHTNDVLGPDIGDGLLKAVADRLRECLRASDTVSRQGGDEFAVLLPQVTCSEHAQLIARKMLLALRASFVVERREINITASIGIAIHPADGKSAEILVKNADIAMYHAKNSGRDNCQLHRSRPKLRSVGRQAQ